MQPLLNKSKRNSGISLYYKENEKCPDLMEVFQDGKSIYLAAISVVIEENGDDLKKGDKMLSILEMRCGIPMLSVAGIFNNQKMDETTKVSKVDRDALYFPIDDEDEDQEVAIMTKIAMAIDLSQLKTIEDDGEA